MPGGLGLTAPRAAVAISALTCRFGRHVALADVCLGVPSGEVHALLGRNGAGKTTLLRTVAGLQLPTDGTVRVLDLQPDLTNRKFLDRLSWVAAGDRSFYLRISGFENLVFFARLRGLSLDASRQRARECLELLGLADAAHTRVGLYSRGMQKRLAVARGLLTPSEVLVLDEATHDVDADGAATIRALVRAEAARGAAVLWATQRLEEIVGFADAVTVLDEGHVDFQGGVQDLLRRSSPRRFVIRVSAVNEAEPALPRAQRELVGFGELAEQGGGRYLLCLHDGVAVGDAIAALAGAGVRVEGCHEERSEVEQAVFGTSADPVASNGKR